MHATSLYRNQNIGPKAVNGYWVQVSDSCSRILEFERDFDPKHCQKHIGSPFGEADQLCLRLLGGTSLTVVCITDSFREASGKIDPYFIDCGKIVGK